MTKFLADVNFLLALLDIKHEHSAKASAWARNVENRHSIVVCRVTQMGVLRLLTKPAIMKSGVLTGAEAWACLTLMLGDPRFVYTVEPAGFEAAWQTICESMPKGSSAETDSYLAAFAKAADLTIVTFDGGFARFPGVRIEIPA